MAGRFSVETVFRGVDKLTRPVRKMQNAIGRMTRKMRDNIKRLNRAVSRVTQSINRGVRRMSVVAAGAFFTVGAALTNTANRADSLAKRARNLQFPIEALQEWQFVAEQSGVATDEFDKSIEQFAKRIGEARSGTGAMVTLLKKQNPELLKQLKNTSSVSDALEIYIDAMRNTRDSADQAALANAGFGRSGIKMIGIAKSSEDAVKALRLEMRENGLITQAQAENAEAYNDAMNSLKLSIRGLIDSVLLPLTPMLTEIARSVREWVIANKDLIATKVENWLKFIVDNFESIVKWGKRILIAVGTLWALKAALGAIQVVMTAVSLAMSLNPIGLFILAVTALIGLGYLLYARWDEVKELLGKLWEYVVAKYQSSGLKKVVDWLIQAAADIRDAFVKTFEMIGVAIDQTGRFLGLVGDSDRVTTDAGMTFQPLPSTIAQTGGGDIQNYLRSVQSAPLTTPPVAPATAVAESVAGQGNGSESVIRIELEPKEGTKAEVVEESTPPNTHVNVRSTGDM